jgi:hypothetical protein
MLASVRTTFCTVHFQSVKVKATLVTHALLRTIFFSIKVKATHMTHAFLRTIYFLVKVKATIMTHAFLETIFFHCLSSVGKGKGDTHDPCFPENKFFPLSVNKTPIKL